jgi:(2Fe-2S) ferredoxin
MYWTKKHVLVCTASHCNQKGAMEVVGKLRLDILRRGLDSEILVNNCGTIDLCDIGPNLVVYPDNVILHGVKTKDLPEIIEYLKGGPVPERLVVGPNAAEEKARKGLFAEAMSAPGGMEVSAFATVAHRHGFDDQWISEQLRRGFLAKKPVDSVEMITVTKKARDRYSV